MQALSGQPYADFGTVNIRGGQLFMNAVGRQMAVERGAGLGGRQERGARRGLRRRLRRRRGPPRASRAWLSGIGSTGSVLGDGNAAGLTYTLGGTAFGIDYRLDPRFLVGIAGGYVGGTQWVNGFSGNGNIDALSVALYGSFTPRAGGFYADALAGYANASNRMQRVVSIPGLPTGIANGNTSANQFLGQIETGYKFGLGFPAQHVDQPVRPPAGRIEQPGGLHRERPEPLQSRRRSRRPPPRCAPPSAPTSPPASTWAAARPLDIGLRLGWMHEFADTARPMTAAFAAAPGQQFTVFGATPQRDSAVVGFSAAAADQRPHLAVRLLRRRSGRRHRQPPDQGGPPPHVVKPRCKGRAPWNEACSFL